MKKASLILLLFLLCADYSYGQNTITYSDFRAITAKQSDGLPLTWTAVTTWQRLEEEKITGNYTTYKWENSVTAPNPTGVAYNIHMGYPGEEAPGSNGTTYGNVYVSRDGDLSFNQGISLTVHPACTLVVIGDLTFLGNHSDVKVLAGGVLFVTGDLTTDLNLLDVDNEGKVIIGGNLDTGNGNTGSVNTGSGNLYVIGNHETSSLDGEIGKEEDLKEKDRELLEFYNSIAPDPLPVNLLYFTATTQSTAIKLDWASSKVWDFSHYELERSADGISFDYLTTIDGEENSNWVVSYSYSDRNPLSGISYYRLKAVDIDGRFEYKGTEVVQFAGSAAAMNVYPNPSDRGVLHVQQQEAAGAKVSLKDNTGKTVYTGTMESSVKTIDTSSLQPGLYVLTVESVKGVQKKHVIIQ